jgi:hypothetical protein
MHKTFIEHMNHCLGGPPPPAAQPAQAEVTVPDDMIHAGEIKIKIAPDGDIHIAASGKDTWTGNDATVVIELTASGGRESAKWHSIFCAAMLTATTQPAAPVPLTDDQCRAAFEVWYSSAPDADPEPERTYELTDESMSELTKECIWLGWQAAHGITKGQP